MSIEAHEDMDLHPDQWKEWTKRPDLKEYFIQQHLDQIREPSLIRNLVFRASSTQKKAIYRKFGETTLNQDQLTRRELEAWAAIYWNWAVDEEICRAMIQSNLIWENLQLLLLKVPNARKNAASCLGTMVSHGNNLIPDWVLEFLVHELEHEQDQDLQRRYMRTLRCWSSSSSFPMHPKLPPLCLDILKSSPLDTCIQACQTVSNLLSKEDNKVWTPLCPQLEAILYNHILQSTSDKLVVAAVQTLTVSYRYCPWKRQSSMVTSGLYTPLQGLVQRNLQENYHLIVSQFVAQRVPEPTEKASIDLCTSLLSAVGPDFDESRRLIVKALSQIAKQKEFSKILAEDEYLLTALVNVCLSSEGVLKTDAKKLVLELVQYL